MRLRSLRLACALVLSFAFVAQSAPTDERPLLGFDRAGAAEEHALETRFDAALNRDDMRAWMKRLTARPHHLGSPYDNEYAEFLVGLYRTWGVVAQIEVFSVMFHTPKTLVL